MTARAVADACSTVAMSVQALNNTFEFVLVSMIGSTLLSLINSSIPQCALGISNWFHIVILDYWFNYIESFQRHGSLKVPIPSFIICGT